MSPERQVVKNMEEWLITRDISTKQKLIDEAVEAFYEDHPEVRQLFITPNDRLEVNFYGESAAFKYFPEELEKSGIGDVAKLKKCMEIFQDLLKKMGTGDVHW